MRNKLNVMIVEDEAGDVTELTASIKEHPDELNIVGVSKNSDDAFAFICNHNPHAVILDLELQTGRGDGLELLKRIRSTVLKQRPYVVVNTNNPSKTTLDLAKRLGADYTFVKWQTGYKTELVVNQLLNVMPIILGTEAEPAVQQTEAQTENKLRRLAQDEFNKIGVSVKNAGYGYLVDAVILAIKGDTHQWGKTIGNKIGKKEDSVTHAMQYAINRTWAKADITELQKHYTATPANGISPTTCEFVFYYRNKILNLMNG